jgi:hypothetical protein
MPVFDHYILHVDVPEAHEQVGGGGEQTIARGRGRVPLRPLTRAGVEIHSCNVLAVMLPASTSSLKA